MCIRKKKNVEPNLDCNTLARPSLFRRAVAWITFIAYVGQPLIVTAQVTADQAAAASKRPVVDVTANGIPLIQIVTPNAAGLSHNQYTQFNVDPSGVILNNSQTTVQTQQAGFVSANPNLVNGSARIILNEVTSTNRSQLNGYTEVAGQPAEVIIANPNGINCNGCGFINASRGVLTTGPDGKPLTKEQKAALIAEREAQAAEKAAQAAEEKTIREAQRLNDHIDHLASQPGQEWIGQLVKTQPDRVRLQQVKAAAEHWDYSHAGLTPEAAAVIVIVVTYFTAGAASTAAAGITGTAATSVASVAVAAGMTTLASQTTLALINNKGDLGKTLDDLGKSDNVKALVTAMVTAGVLQGLSQTININGTSMAKVNAQSSFTDQLQKNVINSAASTTLNHAMYGGDLQQQLEQSFKNAFIDTGAAQGANWIGDMKAKDNFNNFTHKLAHAIAGCAAGAAKSGDCSSGALGAVVGELSAELYGGNRSNTGNPDLPAFKTDTVNFAKMMAGVAVALTGGDAAAINLAAATGGNAAENNWLNHADAEQLKKLKQMQQAGQCDSNCEKSIAGLDLLDKLNNRELINACVNGTTEACKAQIDRDPAALKYGVDNAGVIVVGNIIAKAGDRSKDALASLGKAIEKTQLKPLVNAQGVITGWAVDLGGADPETLRYWAGAGIFVGTEIILPTSMIDLIPGAGKGLTFITRGTERLVVEEATGKVLGKVDDVGSATSPTRFINDVKVVDQKTGQVFKGTIDLQPTFDRIALGEKFPSRNDGTIFKNNEGLLPQQPVGYYTEYVVPTQGIAGPGPQRLLTGRNGEMYYTPDHYKTFMPVNKP